MGCSGGCAFCYQRRHSTLWSILLTENMEKVIYELAKARVHEVAKVGGRPNLLFLNLLRYARSLLKQE